MSKSGHQTNDATARNDVLLLQGHEPTSYIDPWGHPMSPNQRVDAAAGMVGSRDGAVRAKGLAASIAFLEAQVAHGFQCLGPAGNECLTNSHGPHWLRAMTTLTVFAWRLSPADRLPILPLVWDWWEGWRALRTLGAVPSGPLAGWSILPCARNTMPDPVGDGLVELADGGRLTRKGLNAHAQTLSLNSLDTVALPLVKAILSGPTFGPNFRRGRLPRLASRLVVTRTPAGHVAEFPDGIPGAIDAAPRCWADYKSGKYHYGPEPTPFSVLVPGAIGTSAEAA